MGKGGRRRVFGSFAFKLLLESVNFHYSIMG